MIAIGGHSIGETDLQVRPNGDTRSPFRGDGIGVSAGGVMAGGPSVWESATHVGAGHHGIHVLGGVVVVEALSV